MMNCLECRREMLIDPRNETVDLISHINDCRQCRQEREKLLTLENTLENSFNFDVPEGLADRVLEISQYENNADKTQRKSSGLFGGHIWQMAASVVLGVGLAVYLGLNQFSPLNNAYALEVAVINHITDEIQELHGNQDVDEEKIGNIMTAINTKTMKDIGKINYASKCQIRKSAGAHLITNGENGPVTVLVMPGEHIDKDINITSKRFDGAIYSTDYGSLAVVGEKGEQLLPIAKRMLQRIAAASS
jgi:hypothetical protein